MITLAVILLILSISAIAGLFALKSYEERAGRTLLPRLRAEADVRALELKELLIRTRVELEQLPPILIKLLRIGIHDLALAFAALARLLERGAHRLADLVSHKHRFERRESKNQFLKQVMDHKNENGKNGLDTTR